MQRLQSLKSSQKEATERVGLEVLVKEAGEKLRTVADTVKKAWAASRRPPRCAGGGRRGALPDGCGGAAALGDLAGGEAGGDGEHGGEHGGLDRADVHCHARASGHGMATEKRGLSRIFICFPWIFMDFHGFSCVFGSRNHVQVCVQAVLTEEVSGGETLHAGAKQRGSGA